jgi:hypothetical protein
MISCSWPRFPTLRMLWTLPQELESGQSSSVILRIPYFNWTNYTDQYSFRVPGQQCIRHRPKSHPTTLVCMPVSHLSSSILLHTRAQNDLKCPTKLPFPSRRRRRRVVLPPEIRLHSWPRLTQLLQEQPHRRGLHLQQPCARRIFRAPRPMHANA